MFPTPLSSLTDSWRWTDSTSLRVFAGLDGGAVSKNGDLFAVGSTSTSVSGLSSFPSSFSDTASSAQFSVFKLGGEAGKELWVYDQSIDTGVDRAYCVGVDVQGDVIVGGSTTGTWTNTDAYTNNSGPQQLAAFKLDGDRMTEVWQYQCNASDVKHNSSSETGWATAGRITSLAVDSTGDALFVGHVWDNSGIDSNYTYGKIDGASGEKSWQFQGGLNGSFEAFWACGLDSNDNLVAAGLAGAEAANNLSSSDYLVVKFNGEGEEEWRWENGTQPGEAFLAMAIDLKDDVYVAGGEGMVNVDDPIASAAIVVKLDGSSGKEIWRYLVNDSSAPFAAGSLFRGIGVDDNTGVVVAVGVANSSAEQTGSDSTHSVAIVLNATTGEYLVQGEGTALQDEIYFALFDSEGSLFLGGYSSAEGTLAVTKLKSETSASGSSEPSAIPEWVLIFGVTAAVAAALLVCLTYTLCRVRRTIYLSKTVEDFGPVFRLTSANLGGQPSTVKTSRPAPTYQSNSTRSVSSFAGGFRRTAANWSFNASFRNLKLVNGGDSSRGNVGSARVFVTPDSPEGYAPKSPPQQEAPRHPHDVEAPTKFVDVTTAADIDIVAFPGFFDPTTSQAQRVQPTHYNPYPSPAYSVAVGLGVHEVQDSEFVTATELGPQLTLAKSDSAAGSHDDVKDLPSRGVIPDARELKPPDRVMAKKALRPLRCQRGSEYTSPFEKRNESSTHLFPGEYWSSPLNLEATLRSQNLLPYQSKHIAAPAHQRHCSPRLSPPVAQSGRTDSDSTSVFCGDSGSARAVIPLVEENGRNCSGIMMPQVPYPLSGMTRPAAGLAAGLDVREGESGEAATAAPRPPCLKRSFSSEDSAPAGQEETRRDNLHRVESWLTKPTVFPKEVQKGSSLQTQELEQQHEEETPPRKWETGNDHVHGVHRGYR